MVMVSLLLSPTPTRRRRFVVVTLLSFRYYAICLDFQLDTGYTVIPYETCQAFVKEEENFASIRDVYSKHRLFTSLWLW